ncbi:hypothetical protein STVA_48450 [Allostella vacuolata]|nr:hypothetical protein STVA_48450 [Stella vacuolata]
MTSGERSNDKSRTDPVPLDAVLDRVIEAVAVLGPCGALLFANDVWRRLADVPDEAPQATLERVGGSPHFLVRRYPLPDGASLVLVRQDEQGLFRELLDNLDSTLAVYDENERFRFGNAAFHRLYFHHGSDADLLGRTFEELLRATIEAGEAPEPQAASDPQAYIARRLAEFRDRRAGDSERLSPSGRWDLLRTRFTPSGLRMSMRTEITEQKRIQEELRHAKDRLEVEGAARARFVGRLSQDLRTPLSAVLGYAELIEAEVMGPLGSPKYQEYAALIRQSGRRLLDLVEGLLEMSRTEARRGEMQEQAVDLPALLRAEGVAIQGQARANHTQVALILPGGFPALRGDPRMVRQMVQALMSNAVRHTVDGVVTASLRQADDGAIDIEVRDDGVGMTAEVVTRLGEPYFQGARPGAAPEAGAGLGLAIVKDLLRLHQGSLTIASTLGIGTIATLSFPATRTIAP